MDPLVDDPQVEDDEDAEEEPVEEPTAAEIVEAGVSRGQLDSDTTIPVDQRAVDEAEERLIQQFAQDSCKCDLGPNRSPCCTTITAEHFRSVRCQMLELTHDELELVVMGQVMAGCFSGETSSHRRQERGKSYTCMFHHNGMRICQKTFLFLHTMGYGRFKAIKASYMASGVVARVHGNTGKRKKTGLSLNQIQIVQFIMNYAGVCRSLEREGERRERETGVCVCV